MDRWGSLRTARRSAFYTLPFTQHKYNWCRYQKENVFNQHVFVSNSVLLSFGNRFIHSDEQFPHTHRLMEKHGESCSCNTPRQLTWLRPHTSGSVHPTRGTKAELVPECEVPITLEWDPQSIMLQVRSWMGLLWEAGRDTMNLCGTGLESLRVCDEKCWGHKTKQYTD